MRRPSPLPQAPRAATPAPEDTAPIESEVHAEDDIASAVSAAWGDGERVADAPTVEHADLPPFLSATGAERSSAPAAEPDVDHPVSARDVWRASRARRKALRGEVRRFTGRARRRRAVWLGVAAASVVLVVGTVGVAYSPLFALERITVAGTETLPADTIEQSLAAQIGTPLPLVDESAIKQVLVGFPLVESYTLEARPPHDLIVRIVERTPIGVVETEAGWSVVDAAGVVLETTPDPPEGRPVIDAEGGTGSEAFASIARVMRALPEAILDQVSKVEAATRDDVTLTLGATGSEVVWGSDADSPMKALVLEQAMRMRPPGTASLYDVSTPSAIVIR